ncbi:hypothetical protein [Oceanobacillus timonensis]|uniref:hypothetical protein n=1 Tax=Oceanobacillus timonensis TaxID=1926285 RepID=UPI0009BC1184|nr:hypothetical protein [Oceanobacillus timonensis]
MDERLEEFSDYINSGNGIPRHRITQENLKWLIQQAEKAQALKEDNERLKQEIRGYSSQLFYLTSRCYVIAHEGRHLTNKMMEGGE